MSTTPAAAPGPVITAGPGRTIVIPGVTVIDGRGGRPSTGVTVVVEDGVVAAIAEAPVVPDDAAVIDAAGCTVLPGLVDCHVHLNGEQSLDAYRRYLMPRPEVKLFHAQRYAEAMLHAGFTTLRDLGPGHAVALRTAGAIGLIDLPRILAANSSISATGGHGDWTIFPLEVFHALGQRGTLADGEDECREAVRAAFREGADLIKVMPSGGGITNHIDDLAAHAELSPEEMAAVVDETRRRRARVAAHVNGIEGAELAVDAGVHTVEHGVFEPEPRILDAMAEQGIMLVPTLSIFDWVAEHGREAGIFAEGVEAAKQLLELQFRLVLGAHRAGVGVAVGTDNNGVLGIAASAKEPWLLNQAGLPAMDAVTAATLHGARACGLDEQLGTVEVGKVADLLILDRDPLPDLRALADPATGRRVVRSTVPVRPQP